MNPQLHSQRPLTPRSFHPKLKLSGFVLLKMIRLLCCPDLGLSGKWQVVKFPLAFRYLPFIGHFTYLSVALILADRY